MDSKTKVTTVDNFLQNEGFEVNKCVGQVYDVCSTMDEKDCMVEKVLGEFLTMQVLKDLNFISEIRNTNSTKKI